MVTLVVHPAKCLLSVAKVAPLNDFRCLGLLGDWAAQKSLSSSGFLLVILGLDPGT